MSDLSRPPIPLFRPQVPASMRRSLERTLDGGWIGYGAGCRALEAAFTARRGGWALATSSCTSALYLAGRLIQSHSAATSEVIVPPATFVASALAFLQAGVRPVLADVDPRTLLLAPSSLGRLLTPSTRAVLVVHLYGQRHPAMSELRSFADRHGLLLVEDCAHRVDLLDAAAPVGDLLCYSFNAVKELPGGEGGLLWGRHPEHEQGAREISNLGLTCDTVQRASRLHHADYAFGTLPGLKLRSNDIAAALVNAALGHLPEWRAERRRQFQIYDRLLGPMAPHACPLLRQDDDSCLMYVIKVAAAGRERIRSALSQAGIATSVHYPSLTRHPLLGGGDADGSAEDERLVTLPSFLGLSAADIARIAAALERALAQESSHKDCETGEALETRSRPGAPV